MAYRDLPRIINKYVEGPQALDYGTGTGISANFLNSLGLNTIGIDSNPMMLEKAKYSFPFIQFLELFRLDPYMRFDLVFSSFVLFDMKTKIDMCAYLNRALSFMRENGVFIAITGSEELYSMSRNWKSYESNFIENQNLHSGDVARLRLKEPLIEFYDYFWTEDDYLNCLENAGMKVLEVYKPLGKRTDPYFWHDETLYPPMTIYVARRPSI